MCQMTALLKVDLHLLIISSMLDSNWKIDFKLGFSNSIENERQK